MKRLLALVAMVILVATMLTACGDTIRFSKVVVKNSYTDSTPTFTAAEKLELEGGVEKHSGILVLMADRSGDNTVYNVYNVAQKKSVWKESEAKKVSYYVELVEQEDVSWFYVVKTTTTENEDGEDEETRHIAMYDAEGKVIAEAEGKSVTSPKKLYDLVRFEGKVYRVSAKKGIQVAFDISDLKETPSISYKAGDFYIGGSIAGANVVIYNSKLNPVVVYNFPSYATSDNRKVHVLSNGNVLVQYSVSLGEYAEDFDYIKDGEKYSLTSILIDADDGEYETIDLNFIVDEVLYGEDLKENGMDEDLENVALIYKIKNKMVDTSRAGGKLVVLSNKAKLDDTIGGYVKGMYPQIVLVAKNRWAVMSTTGSTFLLNHKGDVVGEVSNVSAINENMLVSDQKKVYDWNLKMVLDMNEHNVEEYTMYENCILMTTKDGATLLYVNGEVTTLIAKADAEKKYIREFEDRAFAVCDYNDNNKFDIYNDKGEVIFSGDGKVAHVSMELVVSEDLYMILKAYNDKGSDLTYILVK